MDGMEEMRNIKVLFIAGFGPIVRDASVSRKLYNQILGIGFKEEDGDYLHTETLERRKDFCSVAAFTSRTVMLWQGFLARPSSCAAGLARV